MKKYEKPEILSPAGDIDSLKAGIYGGCDAIYLGGPKFSARAYASNFTDEDLKEVIDYAHTFGVKIYITINTLIKDSEIKEAYEYAVKVWNMGVDAIIIQDPGLIYLLNKFNPLIELHASTQMTIHNKLSAEYYVGKGLTRIVLSRELSLEEIKDISKGIETEIFIHGALCISYSGKCLMSSMLSGRSGNRGKCAQNCRMHYELIDEEGTSFANGYLLSPKDLSTLDISDLIMDTGTASLKIEGRMKRKEYVYEAVNQYRRAVDGRKTDDKGLKQLFNREGFTHAFMLGNDGRDMMAYKSPRNTGLFLGEIQKNTIKLKTNISLGDGVKNDKSGFIVTKIELSGNPVKSAPAGSIVTLFPKNYENGDMLYKTSDMELLKLIEKKLSEKYPRKHDIKISIAFTPGKPIVLKTTFKGMDFSVYGESPEKSLNNPLTMERLTESLSKTGDTPFNVVDVAFTEYSEGFIIISTLNDIRRTLIEKLSKFLTKIDRNEIAVSFESEKLDNVDDLEDLKLVVLSTKTQMQAYLKVSDGSLTPVFYPFHRYKDSLTMNDVKEFDITGKKYFIRCPEIIKTELSTILNFLDGLNNIKGIVSDNPAIFMKYKDKVRLVGDYKLNILNSFSRMLYSEPDYFTVSQEINNKELKGISNKSNIVAVIYGKVELMISEYCPVGSTIGGRVKGVECSVPCRNFNYSLKDEKGEVFPVMTDLFCRSYIMNSKPINNLDMVEEYKRMGINSFRIDLTTENFDESIKIIEGFKTEESVKLIDFTRGHFKRGID